MIRPKVHSHESAAHDIDIRCNMGVEGVANVSFDRSQLEVADLAVAFDASVEYVSLSIECRKPHQRHCIRYTAQIGSDNAVYHQQLHT